MFGTPQSAAPTGFGATGFGQQAQTTAFGSSSSAFKPAFNNERAEMLLRWKLKGKLSKKQQIEFEGLLEASPKFSLKASKLLSQKLDRATKQLQQHNGHNHGPSNNPRPRVQQSEKQFKCDFCDKTFTQLRNQRAHIRTVHAKLHPKSQPKKISTLLRSIADYLD